MRAFRSQSSLVSATLVASAAGWMASCLVAACSAPALSESPRWLDWLHAGLAAWVVPYAFAAAAALWLALGLALEARFGEPERGRRARFVRLGLLSVLLLGVPGYALVWLLTAKTTAWKPGVSEWQFGLAALALSPLVRLLLGVAASAFERLARGRERRVAVAASLLACLAFAGWALLTASLRERYGASQLIGYGLVTGTLVLLAFAWFELGGARGLRYRAGLLVALSILGVGALATSPSRAALELYYLERPTRWFGRTLSAALPDADADGVPRNLGFLRGGDCDDADPERSPLAFDLPSNHIDENCFGGDAVASLPAFSPVTHVAARAEAEARTPSNVIVIALDSMRFDPRHPTGFDPAVTPVLARLAASGLAFRDFRTCAPRTRESVGDLLGARSGQDQPNAVQALSDRGVHTAFIASDWLARHAGIAGFGERHEPRARYGEFADGEVLSALQKFVAAAPHEPFFLFSHFLGAHEPYEIGAACSRDASTPFGRYECALGELDRKLGVLLASLEANGLADRTVIAITADHGEEFREHGGRYHATTLYDEILHVPFALRVPGVAPGVVPAPLSCLDFLPTVLGAAGFPEGIAARGRDRLRPANGETPAQFARTRLASETALFEPKQSAVVHAGHKLIWDRTTGLAVFFDLARDPHERSPLAHVAPAVEARLLALMDAWLSDQADVPRPSVQVSLASPG